MFTVKNQPTANSKATITWRADQLGFNRSVVQPAGKAWGISWFIQQCRD